MIIVKIITKRDNFALFASFRRLRPDVSEVVMDRVLGYRNICGTYHNFFDPEFIQNRER